jgi:hypothetical protein
MKGESMKRGSTLFLRGVVVLIGVIVLALCILTSPALIKGQLDEYAPVLVCLYVSVIPFFFALFQSFKLLNLIDVNQAFSDLAVAALGKIKYSALSISILYALGSPYLFMVADQDDSPGVFGIGLVLVFATLVIATFAAVLQKLLQNAIDIKSENDLTV